MTGFAKYEVRLFRDSFSTPWGFRLQGGKDLNQPLSVQRVFSNSPAEGELQRGDVIISIGNRSGQELTHKQAKDLIEGGGGQIHLVITRLAGTTQQPPSGRHDFRPQPVQPQQFRTPTPVAPRSHPPKPMPYHGGGPVAGHKPKKINLSHLGGGGPDFGADFSRPYGAPQQRASKPASYRPVGPQGQMLNKVQESLDNIIYSPRSPEPYGSSAPFYGQQPAPPPPFTPNMSMSGQAPQGYVPTYELVDSGQLQEEEEFVPVWERRKTFADQRPTVTRSVRSTPIPKVPKPVGKSPDAPSFGIDYSKAPNRSSTVTWTPQRAPARQPQQQQQQQVVQSTPPRYQLQAETMAPWRETLRTTGVKPWDVDLDYGAQQPVPSQQTPSHQPQVSSAPPPPPPPQKPMKEGDRDWNDSAVFRMIQQEERRGPAPPRPAPKPASAPAPPKPQQYRPAAPAQSSFPILEDELGVSDF